MSLFDVERQTFDKLKSDLIKEHKGKYVLIIGSDLIDIFDTRLEAIDKGTEILGEGVPMYTHEITNDVYVWSPRLVRKREKSISRKDNLSTSH